MLTSKERVRKAIERQEPDKVPAAYMATPEATRNLKEHLGIQSDEKLLQRLGADLREVTVKYVGPPEKSGGFGVASVEEDIWGVRRRPVRNEFAVYNEIVHCPLGEVKDVKELEDYPWPDLDWFETSGIVRKIEEFNETEERWIWAFCGGAFESSWYMRGLDRFLMDLVTDPELAEGIMEKVTDFYAALTERVLEAAGGKIDTIRTGGDIGTQRGMMLSPDLWRKHVKRWSARLIKIHKKYGVRTIYHSCGSIIPVIDDLIGVGVDVLDPIQPGAAGMEPGFLKKNFGDRVCFLGGIDEQRLLPAGSREEVRAETLKYIDVMGQNGGYILAPAHAIQADTPPENIIAMYDTPRARRT